MTDLRVEKKGFNVMYPLSSGVYMFLFLSWTNYAFHVRPSKISLSWSLKRNLEASMFVQGTMRVGSYSVGAKASRCVLLTMTTCAIIVEEF